ncbi:MAG: tetratricopeptide repeat protein [bacterium]
MNRILTWLLIVGLALLPVACAKKTPHDLLKSAKQSLDTGDTMGATIKLKDLVKKHPDSEVLPEANMLLAYCYYTDKDFDTAREYLQKNVDQLGLGAELGQISFFNIMKSFENEGNLDKAIELSRQALEKSDKASEFFKRVEFNLASLLSKKGDKEEARKIYSELVETVETDQDRMGVLKSIEGTYDVAQDFEKVVDLYKTYLKNHPETKLLNVLRFNLALLYRRAEKKDEAMQYYDEAVSGFGKEIEETLDANQKSYLMIQLAEVHSLWDEPVKTEASYLKVVDQFPQSEFAPQALAELSAYMAHRKDFDKAEQYLNKISKDYPSLASQANQQMAAVQRMRAMESETTGSVEMMTSPTLQGESRSSAVSPIDTVSERSPTDTNASSSPKKD